MEINVMTYNIHGGKNALGENNIIKIGNMIKKLGIHVLGLQEVSSKKFIYGKDELKHLSEITGMYCAPGYNIKLGMYRFGNAVLSRYPIMINNNTELFSKGEKRGVLLTQIKVHDDKFYFLTTHLGLDSKERIQQAQGIVKIIKELDGPVILTGDFNERNTGAAYETINNILTNASVYLNVNYNSFALHAKEPDVAIDYIMTSDNIRPLYIRALNYNYSDHLPVIAGLKINT